MHLPSLDNLYQRSQGCRFRKGSANLWMSVTCYYYDYYYNDDYYYDDYYYDDDDYYEFNIYLFIML